ncbi:MAG: hypothetical protein BGN93_00900 [Acinetobacter sp. 39-4]|nr:MAG: hypothetical protein BGN93_00900 [Acinetobacter sp. 39-4]
MGSVNTKSFVLLLSQMSPKSLISGSKITLSSVLKDYNRNEFHHIYPKAYVSKLDKIEFDVNCLANFCILSRADNKKIDCKKPSDYRKEYLPDNATEILNSNLIDESKLIADNFNEFVENRAKSLVDYINKLV